QVLVLLQQSVACHVRVKVCVQPVPLVRVLNTTSIRLVPQQASERAGGSKLHRQPQSTVLFEAQVSSAGVVSFTVTVWEQELELLQQSVTRQVRVRVMPTPQGVPLVRVLNTVMVTLVPQQLSVAVGLSKVQMAPHWTVLLEAQVRLGGLVSTKVTI